MNPTKKKIFLLLGVFSITFVTTFLIWPYTLAPSPTKPSKELCNRALSVECALSYSEPTKLYFGGYRYMLEVYGIHKPDPILDRYYQPEFNASSAVFGSTLIGALMVGAAWIALTILTPKGHQKNRQT